MAEADSKVCCACHERKSLAEYSPDKRAALGVQSRCRPCCREAKQGAYWADPDAARAKRRAYYVNHKDVVLASNATSRAKHATAIQERKRLAYLRERDSPEYKAKIRSYTATNKMRKREYDREYRRKNSEHLNSIKAVWRAENSQLMRSVRLSYKARRRQQEEGGDSSAAICAWEKGSPKICHWCGCKCADRYHLDHYQPLAKGGVHACSNLVIACPTCNLRKNAKDPFEFANQMGRLF